MKEFQRTSLPFLEFQPKDDWDWLALAQHHGLPTRLLDWTYRALSALWFTVKDGPYENRKGIIEEGVVWILKSQKEDFRTDTERYGPRSNKITKIFRPKFISKRISAQDSVFTAHKILSNGKVIKFETHSMFKKKLLKIVIPAENFYDIRRQLHVLGVNSATLFPDLEGLCAHLKWRYFDDKRNK